MYIHIVFPVRFMTAIRTLKLRHLTALILHMDIEVAFMLVVLVTSGTTE